MHASSYKVLCKKYIIAIRALIMRVKYDITLWLLLLAIDESAGQSVLIPVDPNQPSKFKEGSTE